MLLPVLMFLMEIGPQFLEQLAFVLLSERYGTFLFVHCINSSVSMFDSWQGQFFFFCLSTEASGQALGPH